MESARQLDFLLLYIVYKKVDAYYDDAWKVAKGVFTIAGASLGCPEISDFFLPKYERTGEYVLYCIGDSRMKDYVPGFEKINGEYHKISGVNIKSSHVKVDTVKYLYVTTFQNDNFRFYDGFDNGFDIFKKCAEIDEYFI